MSPGFWGLQRFTMAPLLSGLHHLELESPDQKYGKQQGELPLSFVRTKSFVLPVFVPHESVMVHSHVHAHVLAGCVYVSSVSLDAVFVKAAEVVLLKEYFVSADKPPSNATPSTTPDPLMLPLTPADHSLVTCQLFVASLTRPNFFPHSFFSPCATKGNIFANCLENCITCVAARAIPTAKQTYLSTILQVSLCKPVSPDQLPFTNFLKLRLVIFPSDGR